LSGRLARRTSAAVGKRFEQAASRSARCEIDSIRASQQALSASAKGNVKTRLLRP
jgi:hypothetical protein